MNTTDDSIDTILDGLDTVATDPRPRSTRLAGVTRPCGPDDSKVADRVDAALSDPDDFPPMRRAVVPGDRVALAVDPNLPHLPAIVSAVVKHFDSSDLAGMDVVLWSEATPATAAAIAEILPAASQVVIHNGTDRSELAYLAADDAADAIYVHRILVDADVVVPIVRSLQDDGQPDPTSIYPHLVDHATRQRTQTDGMLDPAAARTGWTLGVMGRLVIATDDAGQIVDAKIDPMSATRPSHPDAATLATTSGEEIAGADDDTADLVIVTLGAPPRQQRWVSIERAVDRATRHLVAGGSIVVWSDMSDLDASIVDGEAESDAQSPTADFPEIDFDGDARDRLTTVLGDHTIYLRSELDEELVESAGFAAIQTAAQVQRLIDQADRTLVIRAADQWTAPQVPPS